ncbi:MAG TPA: type II toxin-antitoxin system RelE/ParE family toxin [Acidobacteria bacterium]|nr:type II toxin-antitoxin system RelE/ParE family toxin [Acidobacteriota bacterium]
MSYRIRVSPRAAVQIRTAARWWAENRPKAPLAFAEEIEKGYALTRQFPSAGEPVAHASLPGIRRVLLNRIHYHLYYSVSPASLTVEILALWHTRRGSLPRLG